MSYQSIAALSEQLRSNIGRVIVGKEHIADLLFIALITGGHVLLEDVPERAKRCWPNRWRSRSA